MRETYSAVLYHPLLQQQCQHSQRWFVTEPAASEWHQPIRNCLDVQTPSRDTSQLWGKSSATSSAGTACRDQGEVLPDGLSGGRSISPLCFKVWLIPVGNPLLKNSKWCRNHYCVTADGSSGFSIASKSAKNMPAPYSLRTQAELNPPSHFQSTLMAYNLLLLDTQRRQTRDFAFDLWNRNAVRCRAHNDRWLCPCRPINVLLLRHNNISTPMRKINPLCCDGYALISYIHLVSNVLQETWPLLALGFTGPVFPDPTLFILFCAQPLQW